MSRFHYAMTEQALLFLGTAESVAGSDELFVQDRSSSHIFHKRKLLSPPRIPYSMPNQNYTKRQPQAPAVPDPAQTTDRQLFEALAQSLGKNSVLVTDDYSIVRVYGNISPYVEVDFKSNLKMHLDLLRSPLREEARSLITIALKNAEHRAGVRHLLAEKDDEEIRLDVFPIVARDINERAALVVFTPVKATKKMGWMAPAPPASQCAILHLSITARKGATQCRLQQSA
ncbi:hypothetical protein [Roseovarius aestuarii]|uniref:Uncharacterized protein n=1 Tax=Roseovarius aestuarii TaxID=475083 RepID=A0A1X7BZ26_9RHOB|nr:hypothetical protein [Roseovarius aestuarii]SMC14790.1 hypothetical protein ROA7745_04660 [Roseovarius aestuarii]